MHHVHISAFSLLIICLFLFGMTALLISFFRRPKPAPHYFGYDPSWYDMRQAELNERAAQRRAEMDQHADDVRAYTKASANWRPQPGPQAAFFAEPARPVYYGGGYGGGADMLTGVLLGEAIAGGHHDTIINETIVTGQGVGVSRIDDSGSFTVDSVSDYNAPADSGISIDSGGSFDGGSTGGIDVSW